LSENLLVGRRITLAILSSGKPTPVAEKTAPKQASGSFLLDARKLGAGAYALRAELFLDGKSIARKDLPFERIVGAFTRE